MVTNVNLFIILISIINIIIFISYCRDSYTYRKSWETDNDKKQNRLRHKTIRKDKNIEIEYLMDNDRNYLKNDKGEFFIDRIMISETEIEDSK